LGHLLLQPEDGGVPLRPLLREVCDARLQLGDAELLLPDGLRLLPDGLLVGLFGGRVHGGFLC
jgi:hypothetical protein